MKRPECLIYGRDQKGLPAEKYERANTVIENYSQGEIIVALFND